MTAESRAVCRCGRRIFWEGYGWDAGVPGDARRSNYTCDDGERHGPAEPHQADDTNDKDTS